MDSLPQKKEEIKQKKEEEELTNGVDFVSDDFFKVTKYIDQDVIVIKNHNRKYKLDMKKDLIINNQAIQNSLNNMHIFADLLSKKDKRIDKQFSSIIGYNHLCAFEYLFMKVVDDLEKKEKNISHQEDEQCCICQCELFDDINNMTNESFQKQIEKDSDDDVIQLKDCDGHYFHYGCLKQMLKESHIKCPVCSKIYGVMKGDQPDGNMTHYVDKNMRCAGYNCPTIVINYSINGGVRNGKNHPGTHRTAYLPDNEEGQEVFKLLKTAFDRRLIFTVGRSVTTGQDNVVVWNGIHHKTSPTGGSSHFGYPDPTYFNRVKQELALKGVK